MALFSAVVLSGGKQMTVSYTGGKFSGPEMGVELLALEAKVRIASNMPLGAPVFALDPARWDKDPFVALWLVLETFGREYVLAVVGDVPQGPPADPFDTQ